MGYKEIQEELVKRGDSLSLAAAEVIEAMYQNNLVICKENDKLKESSGFNDGYKLGFKLGYASCKWEAEEET